MRRRSVADYYQARAEWLRKYDTLVSWARELGEVPPKQLSSAHTEVPSPPRTGRETPVKKIAKRSYKKRGTARPSDRRGNGHSQMTLAATDQIVVPISDLSRPQQCLAILRWAGEPLTTEEIIKKAQEIGIDWSDVNGGPSNAVHGGLWKERKAGNVTKAPNEPWELVDPSTAPELDLKNGKAILSASRMTPKRL